MLSPSVLIIGAGPAGSTAARLLATHGARVTLVEARRLPRDKTCAGGVTSKARRWLPDGVLVERERALHKFEFLGGRLPPLRIDEPAAEITMVERARFDFAMASAAAVAGADIRDGERVEHVVEDVRGVTVTTPRRSTRADYLIVADGDPSSAARDLGLGGSPMRRSLALSARVPLSTSMPDDTVTVSFTVARGYAWYFPKGDHACVGVGSDIPPDGQRPSVGVMRDALADFADRAGFDLDGARLAGRYVPQGIRRGPLASRRSVLAGDAAGMADPLLGEGIAYAIGTGRMAAQAVWDVDAGVADDLRAYEARVRAMYGASMRRLDLAARVLERSPTFALALARISPWVRAYGVNVVTGERAPFCFGPAGELAVSA